MNYDYNLEPSQYNTPAFNSTWGYDYDNEYVGADSSPVNAQQFWGFGPGFGPRFGGPFFRPFPFRRFGPPFFGPPFFHRPFWGWGGWW